MKGIKSYQSSPQVKTIDRKELLHNILWEFQNLQRINWLHNITIFIATLHTNISYYAQVTVQCKIFLPESKYFKKFPFAKVQKSSD